MLVNDYSSGVIEQCLAPFYASDLHTSANEIYFCYNGVPCGFVASAPKGAQVICHGTKSFNENPTIHLLWHWSQSHPDWNILYFHSKGASTPPGHEKHQHNNAWRECLLHHLVQNWKGCIQDLENGAELVTCHWLTGQADGSQNIPAGNFLWVKSDFVRTLPSIMLRDRISVSGLFSKASRYEAEVFWGNGPRLPRVVDKHPTHPICHMC